MKKLIRAIVVALAAAGILAASGPAFGAEQHPPKFGVHDTQCTGGSNQPNCPGGH